MLIKHLKIKKETGKKKKETRPFLNVKKLNGKKSIFPKTTCKKKSQCRVSAQGPDQCCEHKAQVLSMWEGRVTSMPNMTVWSGFRTERYKHVGTKCWWKWISDLFWWQKYFRWTDGAPHQNMMEMNLYRPFILRNDLAAFPRDLSCSLSKYKTTQRALSLDS